jgi:hypothetical protein
VTSSTQNEELQVNYSTAANKNPPEGKTTAVVAVTVMSGNSKQGCHRHHSNKHYKKKIVWVLLDSSGSNRDQVFFNKDKPILLPYSRRLVPQL